jgi:hypothetical protein
MKISNASSLNTLLNFLIIDLMEINVNQQRIYVDTDYNYNDNNQCEYHYNNLTLEGSINIINKVYKNSLTEQSLRMKASKQFIKSELMLHQEASLKAMIDKEKELMLGPYYNQVGILDTGPASGKTFTVLSHIAYCKEISGNDIINGKIVKKNNIYYSYNIHNIQYRSTSPILVIVPHNNFKNWEHIIKMHTFLLPLYIEKPSQINKLLKNKTFIEKINESDFVLLSDKYFNKFAQEVCNNNIMFKRIYIDSPEIINIKKINLMFQSGFIWLITNTWYNFIPKILYYTQAYIRNAKSDMDKEFKNELEQSLNSAFFNSNIRSHKLCDNFMSYSSENYKQVIRCRREFVKKSMKLIDPVESEIICKITRAQRALIPNITNKIATYINNNDISNAYYELGVETISISSLMQQIKTEIVSQREKYINNQNINGIIALDDKIKYIEERLIHKKSLECPICFESIKNATFVSCCKHYICGECVLNLITPTCKMKCIYCRKYNSINDIKLIGETDSPVDTTFTKFEQIHNYIKQLPSTSKIIIFAIKDHHFYEILDCFQNNKTSFLFIRNIYAENELSRNLFAFQYKHNNNILCLTESCIQESINLTAATHIITFYTLPYHIKNLLLSRTNSLERSSPLEFVSFLYQDGIQDFSTLLVHNEDQY